MNKKTCKIKYKKQIYFYYMSYFVYKEIYKIYKIFTVINYNIQ